MKRGVATPEELLRYAMSVPGILTTVSGMDSYDVFRQNLAVATNFTPMNGVEMTELENRVKAVAGDGRLEHYKATKMYDAAVGREQTRIPERKGIACMIFVLLLSVLLAQAGPPSPQSPLKENRAPVPVQPAPNNQPTSADVDRLFAIAAMQGNNAEIDMAELALKRGSANEVKGYAAKMIAEHKGLMDEMMPALQRVLSNPPAERLAPADQLAMRHLEVAKPVDFDQGLRHGADRWTFGHADGISNGSG